MGETLQEVTWLVREGIHRSPGDEIAAVTLSRLGCSNQSDLAPSAIRRACCGWTQSLVTSFPPHHRRPC